MFQILEVWKTDKLSVLESGGDGPQVEVRLDVFEEPGSLEHHVPGSGGSHRVDPVLDRLPVRGSRWRGACHVIDHLAVLEPDHPEAEAVPGDAQRIGPVD